MERMERADSPLTRGPWFGNLQPMTQHSAVDSAFQKFLDTLGERNSREQRRKMAEQEIINAKDRALIPMRQLLKRLVDMNLIVSNAGRFDTGRFYENPAPVSFEVAESESSPRWRPGNSLYLDHPAEIEIAIPNQSDQGDLGVVIITCTTDHPDKSMLQGPFRTMGQACEALAEFLARSTEYTSDP